ncbi:Phage integrase family protein [Crateriforma conspicua]|uniref:Phage integrase family protein n=1 Tax=Crateriforma conspicua TaxID=2527996 RepID=A0A5C6FUZ5_9PLAN|nr:site-specific integrase [Crateriforma conspicua]TWU66902.1 Phage integrase family protein [Crateriforma conspicua]
MTASSLRKRGRKAKPQKPAKPYDGFPLTAHASGKWCKKVRGRIHYFGEWSDPDGALQEWLEVRDQLMAGGDRNQENAGADVGLMVNAFLDAKDDQLQAGDLTQKTFDDYRRACEQLAGFFGKGRLLSSLQVADFQRYRRSFPQSWGSTRINNEIARVSAVLNFAYETELVDKPIRRGPNFKRVSVKRQRLERAAKPKKLYSAEEVHQMLSHADVQLRAMIFLGLNAGYGNADCGRLTVPMIDFRKNWLEGLRTKTAIQRAAWLWPETVSAIKEAIAQRYDHAPPSLQDHVFITKRRQPWYQESGKGDAVSQAFRKVAVKAGCHKPGVGFYALRHTFETVAGDSRDQVAVNYVMGHVDDSMAAVYREGIDPKRVKAVCQHVRKWWLSGWSEDNNNG